MSRLFVQKCHLHTKENSGFLCKAGFTRGLAREVAPKVGEVTDVNGGYFID